MQMQIKLLLLLLLQFAPNFRATKFRGERENVLTRSREGQVKVSSLNFVRFFLNSVQEKVTNLEGY